MDTGGFEPIEQPPRAGDQLVVSSPSPGVPPSRAEIIEILGRNGPPFRVRWGDGRESVVYPSSDVIVEHVPHRRHKS